MASTTVDAPSAHAVPSIMSLPGSVNIPVAKLPSAPKPTTTVDAASIATTLIGDFNKALGAGDLSALAQLFVEDGYWRDHLALSWVLRTIHGRPRILEYLKTCATSADGFRLKGVAVDDSTAVRAPKLVSLNPADPTGDTSCGVQFFIHLETVLGTGLGLARLVQGGPGEGWKICTLYTRLEEIGGFEQACGHRRGKGVEHGGKPGRQNWAEKRAEAADFGHGREPSVLVVGAGQAGLTAAARLKMLGVDTLVIDQNERVGDNWRKRYHQLVLHDPVWYDHMPYINFPSHWPIFTPKDKLAEFFEAYVTLLELTVWTSTQLVQTKWEEENRAWTVVVNRRRPDGSSQVRTFKPRHVIQATGHSGKKNMPPMEGIENFRGDRLCHSSEFPGAQAGSRGKKAVVVGSCNSAHDIAQDYLEKEYDVTMVQRSSTHVVSSEGVTEIALKANYSEDGPPVDDGDVLIHGLPTSVLKAHHVTTAARQAEHDREVLDGLARVGFEVDRGPDGAGLFFRYFQRGGGYYINVGASELIAQGKIKVKQGQDIQSVLPHGLRFADGSELQADEIVFATGYQNMRTQTRAIFGDEVADKVGDVWGFNGEGEMRVIYQNSGHPGFWFHGGNLAMCRYYSRLLALQIKALDEGLYTQGQV